MTQNLRILVVDDNRSAADALARVLRKQGDDVHTIYDGATAIDRITEDPPDVVLTDLKMEPVDGMAVLSAARAQRPPVEVIVFTAYGAVDVAVRAMRMGARDFLTKPVTVDQVSNRLNQLRGPLESVPPPPDKDDFIAVSDASKTLLEALKKCAGVPSPVWLEGEIGSGRTYAAHTIHAASSSDGPFMVADLGRPLDWPERGTVVLPDVGDLPEDLQRATVRALQYKPAEVRVISTSGPEGRRQVAENQLRPELYYALAVVVVSVPPLRDREEDILPLLEDSLTQFGKAYGRQVPAVSPEMKTRLRRHSWPGNVRELRNLAERAVVMGRSAFDFDAVPRPDVPDLPTLEPGFSLSDYLEEVEKTLLQEALRQAKGDRNQAGKLLGVERNTLRYKLNKYDLL